MAEQPKTHEKKPEQETSSMDEMISRAVERAIEKALPVATAVAAKSAMPQGPKVRARVGECEKCHQPNGACQGEHRQVVVLPSSRKAIKFFPGVWINGVRYLSNHPGHKIWVPADCNVEYMVEAFERNEEEMSEGRDAVHYSGQMGEGAKNIAPAFMAWR